MRWPPPRTVKTLEPWVWCALRGYDNPAYVGTSLPGDTGLLHIIGGSQRDNMLMMARAAAAAAAWSCATAILNQSAPRSRDCAALRLGCRSDRGKCCWDRLIRHSGKAHCDNIARTGSRITTPFNQRRLTPQVPARRAMRCGGREV